MFRVLCRDFRHHITIREPTKTIHFNLFLDVLHNHNPHLKSISQIHVESTKPSSFTVDYLVNSFGFTPQKALSVSKNFSLFSTEKPDSVISLFEIYGLTKTQISELISRRPEILLSDPDKTLKPKMEFLRGLGISDSDLSKLVASDPSFLTGSLKNQIIPAFNFLKSFIGNNADVVLAFKRYPSILRCNVEKVLKPNISTLLDHGVPLCMISKLIITQPRKLAWQMDRFKEIVKTVKGMGFDPSSSMFICAVRAMLSMNKSCWEKKLAVYQEFGWSENDVLWVFKKQPICMMISEEKIRKGLEFFMGRLKWKPAQITLCSWVMLLSLEKRMIPRCAVLEVLYSKGMIRPNKLNLGTVLKMKDRDFLEKFVIKYQETVPESMKAYNGGIEFAGFGEVLEVKDLPMEACEITLNPL